MQFFDTWFSELRERLRDADSSDLGAVSDLVLAARKRSRKVILAGNGGSAAICSHLAVDFTKALGIRAINFNEADLITCFANDYGYENWVARAIEFYADSGDLVVLISSSGQSANMVNGAKQARKMGLHTVTLSGFKPDNPLRSGGELNLWVNSSEYNIVESVHQTWLLACVDKLAADGVVRRG